MDKEEHIQTNTEEADKVTRRRFILGAGGLAAGAVGSALLYSEPEQPAFNKDVRPAFTLKSRAVAALPSLAEEAAWAQAPPTTISLEAQKMTKPLKTSAGIEAATIISLHDDRNIAFLVRWRLDRAHTLESIDRFRDSMAVQFSSNQALPVGACMGSAQFPVHIVHWKASWQRDLDEGFQDVSASFPNLSWDVYPEKLLPSGDARSFYPGEEAGNPLSTRERSSSVEELTASGFGTLKTRARQVARGQALFRNGWTVLLSLPLRNKPPGIDLAPGATRPIAFALWDGGHQDVGGKKTVSTWGFLEVER